MQNELAALDFNETPFLGTALNQLNLSPEQVDPPLTVLNQGVPSNNDHKQLVSNILTKLERYWYSCHTTLLVDCCCLLLLLLLLLVSCCLLLIAQTLLKRVEIDAGRIDYIWESVSISVATD